MINLLNTYHYLVKLNNNIILNNKNLQFKMINMLNNINLSNKY